MPTPMTVEGANALREELQHRKTTLRQQITKDIAVARGHGDLKENAEYHAAREQGGFNEGRIQQVESMLADAQIIDIKKIAATDKVIFGVTVTLIEVANGKEIRYKIVGEDEADLKSNKISIMSPIARSVIGKSVGDIGCVAAPSGDREYEIDQVEYV